MKLKTTLPLIGDRNGKNLVGLTAENVDALHLLKIPEAQRAIVTATRQNITLRAKRKVPNPVGVPMQYFDIRLFDIRH